MAARPWSLLPTRWGTTPLLAHRKELAQREVPQPLDWTRRADQVACPIARPNSARFLSLGLSEGHRVQEEALYL